MAEYSYRIDTLRSGVKHRTLKAVDAPTADADSNAEIKSSFSGTFEYDAEVDLLKDELRAVQIIGGAESPLGIFVCTTAEESYTAQGAHRVKIEAYDRGYYVKQAKTESPLYLSAGTNYIEAIKSLLHQAGIDLILSTPTSAVLATDREDWDIGTSYLEIVNDLLEEINYYSLYFTLDGYACLRPVPESGAGSVRRTYNELEPEARVQRAMSREIDVFDAANVFLVICQNPDLDEPMTATAENTSPMSSLSIQARGRRIVSAQKVNNIASQEELNKYAQRLCYENMTRAETVSITTGKMSGVELNDIVGLNLNGVQGIYTETGWSVTMKAGEPMTHTLERRVFA